jgi:hypothetical protein
MKKGDIVSIASVVILAVLMARTLGPYVAEYLFPVSVLEWALCASDKKLCE